MKLQRFALAAAGLGLLAVSASPTQALAAAQVEPKPSLQGKKASPNSALESIPCDLWIASPNLSGSAPVVSVKPAKPPRTQALGTLPYFAARASATWYEAENASGTQSYIYGLHLQGSSLYRHTITGLDSSPLARSTRISSGWTNFRAIATANYSVGSPRHHYLYALNTNGRLYRYASSGAGFRSLGSFPGFASFKTMTVISETATYDTLLMTTRQGALYTFRIPTTASATPIRKTIRTSGWASFESLAAFSCGSRGGALVAGVDHDAKAAYLLAMSKANGTKTVFTSYGKIPGTFDGVNHVQVTGHYNQMNSE